MPSAWAARDSSEAEGASPYLLWIIWVFWLFFLWQPLSVLLAPPLTASKVVSLCGMAVFIGLYLWITWQEAFRLTRQTPTRTDTTWQSWTPIALLLGLSVVMIALQGQSALGSLIYVSAGLCGRLTAWRAGVAIVGLTLLAVLLGAVTGSPLSATGQIFFIIPAVGSFVYFFSRAIRVNQDLRRARQEIARLAVSEERLRFARDLHDLLGHTLSLIALKSELARRLVSVSPEQAAIEIGDIESAARQALTEVREAVADYRQPTLASELRAARELLTAAGVACTQQGEPTPLSASAEAALSWTVREGVTNVIRHSHARSCVITLTQQDGRVGVEVHDDGAAATPAIGATRGNGLAGLRERVAALGGVCAAGPAPEGGFRLVVSLPVGATAEERGGDAQAVAAPQMAEG
jgi:two-component system sensor histidine kinase DesK